MKSFTTFLCFIKTITAPWIFGKIYFPLLAALPRRGSVTDAVFLVPPVRRVVVGGDSLVLVELLTEVAQNSLTPPATGRS